MVHQRFAKAYAVILAAHRKGELFTKCRDALDNAIAAKEYGRVAVYAQLCEKTKPPVICADMDISTIVDDYVLRSFALAVLGHEGA